MAGKGNKVMFIPTRAMQCQNGDIGSSPMFKVIDKIGHAITGRAASISARQAVAGEFRSNIHRGGTAQIVEATAEEKRIAVAAAKVMGLNVAGVDIIRSKSGPKVLEVNAAPGLEGIEGSTGKNIAGQIILFIEKQIARKQPSLFNNLIRAINPKATEG